ncbi:MULTISPECIES: hypothetical protein [unclassified Anaerobiospirillum]|uniref:hypothetical protein n=1 Tax=unclassified Anaerobiospirillum TaxID=2647410 RepID=UPI001FF3B85D|nr:MULTISPECIES: hypothetical protein [unclassified Anaerobiospirillum]MCK0535016.1 hypothetical protein [Anaerobiospirillum sp. NML120511]MCK0540238.1 hypothetical protein [Anaerobiospirillum sp. NML02-A-032]
MIFNKNEVLSIDSIPHRVLYSNTDCTALYPISGNQQSKITYRVVDTKELERQLGCGAVRFVEDPYEQLRNMYVSENKTVEENFCLISSIVSNQEVLYSRNALTVALHEASNGSRSMLRKLYRLIARWFQRGQCKAALMPDYRAVGHSPRTFSSNPGRKTGVDKPLLDKSLKTLMSATIRDYVLTQNGVSLRKAYSFLIARYSDKYPDSPVPTFGQFSSFYYRTCNRRDRDLLKHSPIVFNKDILASPESEYEASSGPGDVYEVDSTPDNVFLCSSLEPAIPVGRPVLYSVTDRFTGMIVGIHVSLENAHNKSAAEALFCAISDKSQYFKENFDIHISFDWPSFGIPNCICADNAELEDSRIERFARNHGVTVINSAPNRADHKSTVESSIGMLQSELRFMLKQSTVCEIRHKKAGSVDNRTNSVLTLNDYRRIVLLAVNTVNARIKDKMPNDYPVTQDCSPVALWSWGCANRPAFLKSNFNHESLRLSLLPQKNASVSRDGIKCYGMTYTCKQLENEGWFDGNSKSMRPYHPVMSIDNGNVGIAWIYPDPEKYPSTCFQCRLKQESAYLNGCSLFEAEKLQKCRNDSRSRTQQKQNHIRSSN